MKVNLDINQRNAVYIKEKNVLVVASPGSGKTTVIINRVNHLIEDLKINEGNIIVITFTRAAADNMRNRYKNIFKKEKINPMIGAAGISAFPMSARVVQKLATKEDPQNFILMYSVSANVSGQIASVIAGGLILGLLS